MIVGRGVFIRANNMQPLGGRLKIGQEIDWIEIKFKHFTQYVCFRFGISCPVYAWASVFIRTISHWICTPQYPRIQLYLFCDSELRTTNGGPRPVTWTTNDAMRRRSWFDGLIGHNVSNERPPYRFCHFTFV